MAANRFDVAVLCMNVSVCLWRWSFESAPSMEAACEAVRLIPLPHQPELPRVFRVLRAHVLDVNLGDRGEGGGRKRLEHKWSLNLFFKTKQHSSFFLTWQALRLSLISTWLVWVPTHMYTWGRVRERTMRNSHMNSFADTLSNLGFNLTSLPLSSNMMSSSARSSWQKSEHFSDTEK